MQTVGIAHCQSCNAMINVNWSACLACQTPIALGGQTKQSEEPVARSDPSQSVAPGTLAPATWVEFDSPLFGRCTGLVTLLEGDRLRVDQHSILKASAWIHVHWLIKVLPGPPKNQGERDDAGEGA